MWWCVLLLLITTSLLLLRCGGVDDRRRAVQEPTDDPKNEEESPPPPKLDDEGCPRAGLRPRKRPGGMKDVPPQIGKVGASDPELARELFRSYLLFVNMPPDVSRSAISSPYDCALPCAAEAEPAVLTDEEVLGRLDASRPPLPLPKPKGVFGAPSCPEAACGAPADVDELAGRYACARSLHRHLDRVVELAEETASPPQTVADALHFLVWVLTTRWAYSPTKDRPCVDLGQYAPDPKAKPEKLLFRLREVAQAAQEAARRDPGSEHCGPDLLWHHGRCCKRCVSKAVCETHDAPKFEAFDQMEKNVPEEQVLTAPFVGTDGFVPFGKTTPAAAAANEGVTFLLRHAAGPRPKQEGQPPMPGATSVGCEGHWLVKSMPREQAAAAMRPLLTPDGRLGRLKVAQQQGPAQEYQPESYDGRADLEELRKFARGRADLASFSAALDACVQLLTEEAEVQGVSKRWGYFKRLGARLVELGTAMRGVPSPWGERAAAYVLTLMDAPQPVVDGRKIAAPEAVTVPGAMLHGGERDDCEAAEAALADAQTRASREGSGVEVALPESAAAKAVRRRGELLASAGSDGEDVTLTPAQLRLRDAECRALFGRGYAWLHACNNCVRCPDEKAPEPLPRAAEARRRSVLAVV